MQPSRTQSAALFLATASALLLIGSVPAVADLKLCNTTSSRIGVAIGYRDTTGWTTEGWWTLAAQTCETLYKGPLTSRYWYVHAIDYDRGGEWAGQSFMCTREKAFTIRGIDCAGGARRTGFFEVDTQAAADWTIRLTDPGEGARLK
jgi:uncharacterized membrane protein